MKAAVSWQILVGMAALPGRACLLLSESRSLFFPFPVPLVHQGLPISLSGSATGAIPQQERQEGPLLSSRCSLSGLGKQMGTLAVTILRQ